MIKAAEGRVGLCCGRRLQGELSFLRWDGAQGPAGSQAKPEQGLEDFTHTKLKLFLSPFFFSSFSESFSCSFTVTTSCKVEAVGGIFNIFPQTPRASSWGSLYPYPPIPPTPLQPIPLHPLLPCHNLPPISLPSQEAAGPPKIHPPPPPSCNPSSVSTLPARGPPPYLRGRDTALLGSLCTSRSCGGGI